MVFKSEQSLDIPTKDVVSWILDNPDYDQDKPIYFDAADPSRTISYREAKTMIRSMIKGFRTRGFQNGDSVCMIGFNNIFYSMVWLSVIGAGGRFVGANPSYKKSELEHLFHLTDTKFVICEPSLLEKIHPATQSSGISDASVFVFGEKDTAIGKPVDSWRVLLEDGEDDWYRFDDATEQANKVAVLAQTSGTTGLPKAAKISHRNLVAYSIQGKAERPKPYEARSIITLPSFHAFASPIIHLLPLKWGLETYILKRYDFASFMDMIERYNITEVPLAPPIILDMLKHKEVSEPALQGVRYIFYGGAAMTSDRLNDLRAICHPDTTVGSSYGMTEIGQICQATYFHKDSGNSVGKLMPGNEARIFDEEGNELTAPDAYGEIVVRGPGIMGGYLGNDEATEGAFIDGWLKTGDIGRQENGYFFIEDRAKDLIKVRGWQVSPTEIEQTLVEHPKIRDAAVIGIDLDDGVGEQAKGFIVRQNGEEPITEAEIRDFVKAKMASYKQLTGGIEFIDAIPRNPSGKILKRQLKTGVPAAPTAAAPAAPVAPAEPVAPVEPAVPMDVSDPEERAPGDIPAQDRFFSLLIGLIRSLFATSLLSLLTPPKVGLSPGVGLSSEPAWTERSFNRNNRAMLVGS